jgi:hypothetical protein
MDLVSIETVQESACVNSLIKDAGMNQSSLARQKYIHK